MLSPIKHQLFPSGKELQIEAFALLLRSKVRTQNTCVGVLASLRKSKVRKTSKASFSYQGVYSQRLSTLRFIKDKTFRQGTPNLRYGKAFFYNLAPNVLSRRKHQLFPSEKKLKSKARAPKKLQSLCNV